MIDFLSRDLWKLQQEQPTVLTHHYLNWQQWEEANRPTDGVGALLCPHLKQTYRLISTKLHLTYFLACEHALRFSLSPVPRSTKGQGQVWLRKADVFLTTYCL